jgi:4'-phosphopantetheinyl transferase
VWRTDLLKVTDGVLGLLGPSERARAARFPRAHDGLLWARSRGLLRLLLGRYLDVEPATVRFGQNRYGKPFLTHPVRPMLIEFSLSHSGSIALFAFTVEGAVGVDVQTPRARPIDEVAIARRAFGPAEAQRMEGLRPTERAREFLAAWVRHEAVLKFRGTGLGGALETGALGAADYGARTPASDITVGRAPWVTDLELGEGAAGAVAVSARPRRLLMWQWEA